MKRRFALGLFSSLALLGATGCAEKPPEPAPVFTEVPAQSFSREWALDLSNPKDASSKVEWVNDLGAQLVVFKTDRNAYVIDKRTGNCTSIDAISGIGPVLKPFSNGKLIGYPVSTGIEVFDMHGKLTRTMGLSVAVESTATFSPTTIYVGVAGMHGARIYALDPNRAYNTPVWELLVRDGAIQSAPIFSDGALYFATTAGHVYAVSEKKESIWPILGQDYFAAGPITADLGVDADSVYLASLDTKLSCLNKKTGRVRWEYYAQEELTERPIITDTIVYQRTRNAGLTAIDKKAGEYHRKPLWINHEATKFLAEDAKYAYVLLRNNAIGALDIKTGAIAFRSPPSNIDFFVTNNSKDGLIYGITKPGYVTAIKPIIAPGTMGTQMFVMPTK